LFPPASMCRHPTALCGCQATLGHPPSSLSACTKPSSHAAPLFHPRHNLPCRVNHRTAVMMPS
jgi:hypothetical protein